MSSHALIVLASRSDEYIRILSVKFIVPSLLVSNVDSTAPTLQVLCSFNGGLIVYNFDAAAGLHRLSPNLFASFRVPFDGEFLDANLLADILHEQFRLLISSRCIIP